MTPDKEHKSMLPRSVEEMIAGSSSADRSKLINFTHPVALRFFQYSIITLGAAIFGLAMTLFILPHKIAPGGISGVAVILNHHSGIPAGFIMLAFNIPIFFAGLKVFGRGFGAKSLYGTVMISVFTDLFNEWMHLSIDVGDPMLSPVFGGIVLGVGLGLILKMGGATSGSGTLARIIANYTGFKHGNAILVINTLVVAWAGFTFHSTDLAMYGLLALYVSSKVIDVIMEGMGYARGAFIISSKTQEVGDVIVSQMNRGATALKGRGVYTDAEREVLFCIVTRRETVELVAAVRIIDPLAFVVITEVHEVLGEGFRPRI